MLNNYYYFCIDIFMFKLLKIYIVFEYEKKKYKNNMYEKYFHNGDILHISILLFMLTTQILIIKSKSKLKVVMLGQEEI